MNKNLKMIYGLDLIAFGIVLACHLFVDKFNFNDYWLLFLIVPSLFDVLINKNNFLNVTMFIISTSFFGYFIFDNLWVVLIIMFVLTGLLMVFGKFISKKEAKIEEKTKGPF